VIVGSVALRKIKRMSNYENNREIAFLDDSTLDPRLHYWLPDYSPNYRLHDCIRVLNRECDGITFDYRITSTKHETCVVLEYNSMTYVYSETIKAKTLHRAVYLTLVQLEKFKRKNKEQQGKLDALQGYF